MAFALLLHLAFYYGLLASGQLPPQPPLLPLAVKNPYLNAWRRNAKTTDLSDTWPVSFTMDRILGWDCLVRVDDQAYHWMGYEFNPTTLISSEITPTKTILRLEAGPIQFNATFLSPIEPDDYVRQSIPFTYMYIDGFSFDDSQPHSVQVYSDITGEWATSDNSTRVKWDTKENHDMVYHSVTRQQPQPLQDNDNAADDGTVYFAMSKRPGHVWRTGSSVDCRNLFGNGTLSNGNDSAFRAVDKNWPVFSHAVDLGTISPGSQPDPVVWALGLVRDPLLVYSTLTQPRTGYYWSAYSDVDAVISAFLNDFEGARDRSLQLDNKIISDASQVSAEYTDLLSLATRQIFGSMDITLAKEQDGSFNISDVKIFMKDMGASARANPVEVLYGALPALLYFNSSIAGHLIEPLLELQASAPYAAPDLGTTYPSILGNDINNTSFVLDSTGSMLVMAYAHAVKSGDGSLLSRYHSTLARWADYLVNNVLDPPFGTTTLDHLSTFGMTNLALKGILGLYSMAKVNEAVGSTNTTYMDHATQLASRWRQFAVTDSHIMSIFNQSSSWGLMYNLFYATWLDSDIVNNSTLSLQAEFYAQQTPIAQYGYELDSSNDDIAYSHWTLLTTATIPDELSYIRDQLIHPLHQRAFTPQMIYPLPMTYRASTGAAISGKSGSAIHGAAYGLLALSITNVEIKANPVTLLDSKRASGTNKVGAIAGGVIGGITGVILLMFAFICWRKRRESHRVERLDYTRPQPFASELSSPSSRIVRFEDEASMPGSPSTAQNEQMSSKQRETSNMRPVHHASMPSVSVTSESANTHTASSSTAISNDLRLEVAELRRQLESVRQDVPQLPPYS